MKNYKIIFGIWSVFSLSTMAQPVTLQPFKPRTDFGAKFEPKGKVLSGAGQAGIEHFDSYVKAMDASTRPVINMEYMGLGKQLKNKSDLKQEAEHKKLAWFKKRKESYEQYPWYIVMQLGLSMTVDGSPELHYEDEVAEGLHDAEIEDLCDGLKAFGRPVYLRIGYEFNGTWNGYKPESYKKAFRHIVEIMKKNQVTNVSTVWCYAIDGSNHELMGYYPGNDLVDWWGVDLFSKTHFTNKLTPVFLDSSVSHHKPVMIGESTPRYMPVQAGEYTWNGWFVPYFNLIREHANIKAFCYINWNWDKTMWADWGDGTLQTNVFIREHFRNEVAQPVYLNGTPKESFEKQVSGY